MRLHCAHRTSCNTNTHCETQLWRYLDNLSTLILQSPSGQHHTPLAATRLNKLTLNSAALPSSTAQYPHICFRNNALTLRIWEKTRTDFRPTFPKVPTTNPHRHLRTNSVPSRLGKLETWKTSTGLDQSCILLRKSPRNQRTQDDRLYFHRLCRIMFGSCCA